MIRARAYFILASTVLILSCSDTKKEAETENAQFELQQTNEVVLRSEINWEALHPARGNKSPKAGTVWGNRKVSEATGFLAKFVGSPRKSQ